MNKRGLSPLIATVLIIGFTVVLASLLILWIRGINEGFMGGSLCDYQISLKCTQLELELSKISSTNDNVTVTLISNSNIDVNNLILQAFGEQVIISSVVFEGSLDDPVIKRLESSTFSLEISDIDDIDQIRIIPGILVEEDGEICNNYCSKIVKEVDF